MNCFTEWVNTIANIFGIISGIVAIVALGIAIKTLNITNTTLDWFKNDRKNQDEKEFRDEIIYKNIQYISIYILDIVKIRASGKYIDLNELLEAQKSIVVGRTALELYANAKDLPYLKKFCEVDEKSENKEVSFMYNFFNLNENFLYYRDKKRNKKYKEDTKLDDYKEAFSGYLQLAMDYSTKVLNLEEDDPENKFVIQYEQKLKDIVNSSHEKNLLNEVD